MSTLTTLAILIVLTLFGLTAAVDTENGERVGGCQAPEWITSTRGVPSMSECQVDTDCTGIHKCCPGQGGLKLCVDPIPACRDGRRIDSSTILEGTCAEVASMHCLDVGCEDGPQGPGGWVAACCGGYAFEWMSHAPRPTCENGDAPLEDSEGEIFWCGSGVVRSCPQNSECETDKSGYQVCCSTPPVCTPGEFYSQAGNPCHQCECGPDSRPTNNCLVVDCVLAVCAPGKVPRMKPDACCEFDCIDRDCSDFACAVPACSAGTVIRKTERPESCCPLVECVTEGIAWVKDGQLTSVSIIAIVLACLINIIAVVAVVACCFYTQKQRGTQHQQFNNLYSENAGDMKKTPLTDTNDVKAMKEKEAFQNL